MSNKQYFKQLDSLRTFAVAGVALSHWVPESKHYFPLASGVQLFFVLSGFLITAILLNVRKRIEAGEGSFSYALKSFFARRFLRIFPLYYATLAIAWYWNVANLRHHWGWHATYFSNFYFVQRGDWHGEVSHFWSLAVEEQFYLFWPIVILFTPWKRMWAVLWFIALSAPIYRWIGAFAFSTITLWDKATIGSFDSLAMGAILAYSWACGSGPARKYVADQSLTKKVFASGAATSLSIWAVRETLPQIAFAEHFFQAIAFAALVNLCVNGVKGPIGTVLNNDGLAYLGKISYGLYVIHLFAGLISWRLLPILPGVYRLPGKIFVLNTLVTVILAALSWHLFECHLNRLKVHFPYIPRTQHSTESNT